MTNAHAFSFPAIDGGSIDLAEFAGRPVLVVNSASQCGFTRQYGNLQALYEEYRDRGFVVIAVPSNDFGAQEQRNNSEIAAFTSEEYEVDFPIAAKSRVKGPHAIPFYVWAGKQAGMLGRPRWNFHKYLIGADGSLVTWFSPLTPPNSVRLRRAIETALQRSAPKGIT